MEPRVARRLAIIAAALLVAGGAAFVYRERTRPADPAVFVVIDQTRSYVEFAQQTLPSDLRSLTAQCVDLGCHLMVDGLTGDSVANGTIPVNETLEVPGGQRDGGPLERQATEALVTRVLTTVQERIRLGVDGQCSDAIGALRNAAEALAAAPDRDPSIVMFSDGMVNCPAFDLREIDRSAAGIDRAVADLRRGGSIPDLHGVTVRIVGGGRTPSRVAPEEMQAFWHAVLLDAGARLPVDWWGARYQAASPR